MRDVEYISRNGLFNLKALTPKAAEVMLNDIGLEGMIKFGGEVFMMRVDPFKLDTILARLRAHGLQTEPDSPKKIDVSTFTDF